jgi:hypothetical protein
MKNALLAAMAVVTVLVSAGCETHEAKYEQNVPPPRSKEVADAARAAEVSSKLVHTYLARVNTLPPEALAPLAQASALLFEATGAPGAKTAAQTFAATLLGATLSAGRGQGFFNSASPNRPSAETTLIAGNALVDVFRITRDRRYFAAVESTARGIMSPQLGWTRTQKGFAIRVPHANGLYSIPLTAEAALFLQRAATIGAAPGLRTSGSSAFRFVDGNQAAVGRWYLNAGANTPMTLATWARTLLALASTSNATHQGVVGGGEADIWAEAFSTEGAPRRAPVVETNGLGVASALRLFQRFDTPGRHADKAYAYVLGGLRADGTIAQAGRGDSTTQAYYALAFAERAFALRHPAEWDKRRT